MHQVIWNNKYITVKKLSTFGKDFYSKGIIAVGDLLSDAGVFLKGVNVLNANLSPIERFKLMGIVDAIPREWIQIIDKGHNIPCPRILVTHFI